MSTWESVHPSDSEYLTAADLDMMPSGTVTATIESVTTGDFEKDDGSHTRHGVIAFVGKERKWVLNRTNVILLRALFPTPEDAVGHKITLMAEDTRLGSKKTRGIRLKGSPELSAPVAVTVKLPRRKATIRQLVPTGSGSSTSSTAPVGCEQRDPDICRECDPTTCTDVRGPLS